MPHHHLAHDTRACRFGANSQVADALGWVPEEFAFLKADELVMLHEDSEFLTVALKKLDARLRAAKPPVSAKQVNPGEVKLNEGGHVAQNVAALSGERTERLPTGTRASDGARFDSH